MQKKKQFDGKLAEKLKQLRKMSGLTQEEVTARLNEQGVDITRQSYNRYENNNAGPDHKTLSQLAIIFNTDVNDLLDFEPKQTTSQADEEMSMRKTIHTMISTDVARGSCMAIMNEDKSGWTFKLENMVFIDGNGNLVISPKDEFELTKDQLVILNRAAKKVWDRTYYTFFHRVLRLVNESGSPDEYIKKLESLDPFEEDKEIKDLARTTANYTNINES